MPKRKGPEYTSGQKKYLKKLKMATRKSGYAKYLTPVTMKKKSMKTKVDNLYRMIETKEITWKIESTALVKNYLPHNQLTVWTQNPFQVSQGAADQMQEGNQVNRLGDRISVKGMMLKGFFENALERSKVYFRVMLVRAAKGDTIDRSTLFKGNCNNKMMDQVNTERFSIVAQKTFTCSASNSGQASSASASGQPLTAPTGTATWFGGQGTKTFQMWIPGNKFGNNGNIQFENGGYQVKFYDYRWVVLAYDWFGTPQDSNNVGMINVMYTKVYFKDA